MVTRSHKILPALPVIGRFDDSNTISEIFPREYTPNHEALDEEKLTSKGEVLININIFIPGVPSIVAEVRRISDTQPTRVLSGKGKFELVTIASSIDNGISIHNILFLIQRLFRSLGAC